MFSFIDYMSVIHVRQNEEEERDKKSVGVKFVCSTKENRLALGLIEHQAI